MLIAHNAHRNILFCTNVLLSVRDVLTRVSFRYRLVIWCLSLKGHAAPCGFSHVRLHSCRRQVIGASISTGAKLTCLNFRFSKKSYAGMSKNI